MHGHNHATRTSRSPAPTPSMPASSLAGQCQCRVVGPTLCGTLCGVLEPWAALFVFVGLVFQAELFWAFRRPIGRIFDSTAQGDVQWYLGWPWVSGGVGLVGAGVSIARLWSAGYLASAVLSAALATGGALLGYWIVRTRGGHATGM